MPIIEPVTQHPHNTRTGWTNVLLSPESILSLNLLRSLTEAPVGIVFNVADGDSVDKRRPLITGSKSRQALKLSLYETAIRFLRSGGIDKKSTA